MIEEIDPIKFIFEVINMFTLSRLPIELQLFLMYIAEMMNNIQNKSSPITTGNIIDNNTTSLSFTSVSNLIKRIKKEIAIEITPAIPVMDTMSILLKIDLSSSIFEMFFIANSMRIQPASAAGIPIPGTPLSTRSKAPIPHKGFGLGECNHL